MFRNSRLMYSVGVGAMCAVASPAFAQSQSEPVAPPAAAVPALQQAAAEPQSGTKLEEIIVTARRQRESILKVPVAASALSSADLARSGTQDILSLSGQIPSVKLDDTSGGGGSFTIRGVGSSVIDGGVEQSVVTVIDGIQTARGVFIQMGLLDLAQVEVLKGPQVLFFGKNGPGVVLSLTSKGPTDKLEAYLKGSYEVRAHERIIFSALMAA